MIQNNSEGFFFFNIAAWLIFWGLLATALLDNDEKFVGVFIIAITITFVFIYSTS